MKLPLDEDAKQNSEEKLKKACEDAELRIVAQELSIGYFSVCCFNLYFYCILNLPLVRLRLAGIRYLCIFQEGILAQFFY